MDEDPDSPLMARGPLALQFSDEDVGSNDHHMSLSCSRSSSGSSGTHSTDSTSLTSMLFTKV